MDKIEYYLVCYKNKNPFFIFARIIEWVDKSKFSHVEIVKVVNDDWDNAITFGAVFPRSRSKKLTEMKIHYEIIDAVKLNVITKNPDAILMSLLGKPYSFVQIFLIGIMILTKTMFSCLPNLKVNLSKDLICTELAGLFMQEACQYKFSESPEMLGVEECRDIAIKSFSQVV